MTMPYHIVRVGATGTGKSFATARDIIASADAELILDPEKDSLAATVLTHATGDVLFDRLDDYLHALGFDMLAGSTNPDPELRYQENLRRARAFAAILLRRRDQEGMAQTPLLEEWITAAVLLFIYQE
jgi:hypothetical protein